MKIAMRRKQALLDCLIAATFFLLLTSFTCQTALAGTPGYYYVFGTNNTGSSTYYGINGYQRTVSVSVTDQSSVWSFVALVRTTPVQQFAIGFMQGRDPNTWQWLSTPYYYVDRVLNGVYAYWRYSEAPVGTNHYYTVFCDGTGSNLAASIDGDIKKMENGYYAGGKVATAETETHNNDDYMNHHFWGMQFRTVESRWFSFYNTQFHQDSPYHYNIISNMEWYAYK